MIRRGVIERVPIAAPKSSTLVEGFQPHHRYRDTGQFTIGVVGNDREKLSNLRDNVMKNVDGLQNVSPVKWLFNYEFSILCHNDAKVTEVCIFLESVGKDYVIDPVSEKVTTQAEIDQQRQRYANERLQNLRGLVAIGLLKPFE